MKIKTIKFVHCVRINKQELLTYVPKPTDIISISDNVMMIQAEDEVYNIPLSTVQYFISEKEVEIARPKDEKAPPRDSKKRSGRA